MSPRDKGAAPSVEMAIIESDVHHLREQTDRDRRAVAERLVDLRNWRERIETTLATIAAQLARLEDRARRQEADGQAQTEALSKLATGVLEQRGALRFLTWAVPVAVALTELGIHLAVRR